MRVRAAGRWVLGAVVVVLVVGVPAGHFRTTFDQTKRLRVVTDGRVYRSGQMTADGFREALTKYRVRTVVNLQSSEDDETGRHDWSDPQLPTAVLAWCPVGPRQKESDQLTFIQAIRHISETTNPNALCSVYCIN